MRKTSDNRRLLGDLQIPAEVVEALIAPHALPELLENVMVQIVEVARLASIGAIMIWDSSMGALRTKNVSGANILDRRSLHEIRISEGEAISGKVYLEGKPMLLNSPTEVAGAQNDMTELNRSKIGRALGSGLFAQSVLAVPLQAGSRKFGVLALANVETSRIFSEEDVSTAHALADLIALAIDRVEQEDDLRSMHDVQKASRLRGEVMAKLSHELRTPLAAIRGYATALLLDEIDWSSEKSQQFLRLIDEECQDLQTMITDILDSSLIDVGQLSLDYQPVRLERLADDLASEMQRRTETHRFLLDFPQAFPIVDADPHRIKQIMRNIIDNAIKYSPDGGMVVIRGEVRDADVVISIADQGVGISPEDLIPLFEKYFRVKSATGYHVPGTGLGLPVAREIVEAHGGRIWAKSELEEGTTLFFSIPSTGISAEADGANSIGNRDEIVQIERD
jgi:K+-sensing histidine kinase KdpD